MLRVSKFNSVIEANLIIIIIIIIIMLMSREDISRNTKNNTWTVPVHNKQTLKKPK